MTRAIFREDQTVILVKIEAAPGVDSLPEAADVIVVNSLTVKRDKKFVDAPLVKSMRGNDRKKFVAESGTIEIECDLALGGANGVAKPGALPMTDVLLRSCAMQRLQSTAAINSTAQGGSKAGIILAAGSSSTDDYWAGHTINVKVLSGAAQAPSAATKNLVKLAANTVETSGTAGSASTTSTVVLAATASSVDGDYVGQGVTVGSETSTATGYDGATKTLTVSPAYTATAADQVYKILFATDDLVGYQLSLVHYSGTVVDNVAHNSTLSVVYLPVDAVGTANLRGMLLRVVTAGGDPETIRIAGYDVKTRKCLLAKKLSVLPTGTSTFTVLEQQLIAAFNATTKECMLAGNLVQAAVAGEAYTIGQSRLITAYDGTSLFASVDWPLSKYPNTNTDYSINPFVSYTALSNSTGEESTSIYYYEEDVLYRFVACKGTCTFDRNSGESDKVKFTLTGLVGICEDSSRPATTMSRYVPSLPVSAGNTYSLAIMGYQNAALSKFSVDIGNKVLYRNVPNDEGIYIMSRASQIKASMDKTTFADFDLHSAANKGDALKSWFVNGYPGNQISMIAPLTAIMESPGDSKQDGIRQYDLGLSILPDEAGGIDFKLVFN